jgi:C-terminal processing protease CtpA/Prc
LRRSRFLIAGGVVAGAIGLASAATATVYAPHSAPFDDRPPPDHLEPREMRADLETFARTVREVGTDPFATSSPGRFDAARAQAEAACTTRLPIAEFWRHAARLAAALNDGHVAIEPTFFLNYVQGGGRILPLELTVDADGALIAARDLSAESGLPRGSQIVAVNGRSAESIVDEAIALNGGQRLTLRRAFARPQRALFALDGPRDRYEVTYRAPGGEQRLARIAAATAEEMQKRRGAFERVRVPYRFRMLSDGIGRIDYDACEDKPRFKKFLAETFTRIRATRPRALVVDLRRNGGGASSLNDELFAYVTDRPYEQYHVMRVRASARLKHELGIIRYASMYGPLAVFAPNGMVTDLALGRPSRPPSTPLRYDGPVYYLIGTRTFSSALSCALAVKDFGLGTLVGEETGEPALSTGETYSFQLPNSRLNAWVTTKLFLPSKAHPKGEGVVPDVHAPTTPQDLARGRDPGLEAIRKRLA